MLGGLRTTPTHVIMDKSDTFIYLKLNIYKKYFLKP